MKKPALPEILESERSPLVDMLLKLIEWQSDTIDKLSSEVNSLKAEVKRLKKHPSRPKIEPSKLDKKKR